MSENRFKLHIEWSNIDKTDGIAELSDNGQPLLETECIEDARLLQTILNELNDENKELKAEIEQSDLISEDIVCADIQHQLLKVTDENKELKKENKKLIEEWEFSFRTEMAHHRFAEKELQEKIRKKQARIKELEKENEQLQKETVFLAYWKRKAMILLMQVRRLTPRMTDKEVIEFSKELEDE